VVKLIREQITRAKLQPSQATIERRERYERQRRHSASKAKQYPKGTGQGRDWLEHSGTLLREIATQLTRKGWVTHTGPNRAGASLSAEGMRRVVEALKKAINLKAILRDRRYWKAQLQSWRKAWKVGRLR
jgi:hypothetical protein